MWRERGFDGAWHSISRRRRSGAIIFDACRTEGNDASDDDWEARFHAVMREGNKKSDGGKPSSSVSACVRENNVCEVIRESEG